MDKRGGGEGRREYHDFLSKIFCLTVPKNFVGETFSVSLISGIERFCASESYATIFCRNFFCLSAEKFRRGTFLICVSEKIWYRKKIMDKRGGGREEGVSPFSVENFWSHSAKIFRGHPLQCFRKLGVSKNFMHNRGYHVFPSNNDGLTVPKNFVEEPFWSVFQKYSGIEKNYG